MKPLDLTKVLKGYEDKWVALSSDNTRVFGVGNTALEASNDAQRNSNEEFTLLYVEPSDILYCG